jgi:protein-tyrosine phosphatase
LQNGFDMVYEMLDETCGILAKKLIEKHSWNALALHLTDKK